MQIAAMSKQGEVSKLPWFFINILYRASSADAASALRQASPRAGQSGEPPCQHATHDVIAAIDYRVGKLLSHLPRDLRKIIECLSTML